jgi:hypothetical protein
MLVPLFVISFRQLILNLLVWKRKNTASDKKMSQLFVDTDVSTTKRD